MHDYETLVELFENSREQFPSNDMFGVKRDGEYSWLSYEEFGERVDACRGGLAELGVEEGDTVGIIADNCVEWAAAAHATYGLCGRFCPMYEDQVSKEWRYIIEDSDAKVVFVADDEIMDELRGLDDDVDTLEQFVVLEGDDSEERTWEEHLEVGRENPVEIDEPDPDQLCGFIYTSGTTGQPKGVKLSHWNICSNVQAMHKTMEIQEEDVSLAFLPWAHSFGQTVELHGLMAVGASLGLAVDIPETLMENLGEVRPTLLFSVPRIFNKLYDGVSKKIAAEGGLKKKLFDWAMANSERLREQKEEHGKAGFFTRLLDGFFDNLILSKIRSRLGGRLKYAFSGGAALSPKVAEFVDNLHITVYEGYGLTETSPIATANRPGGQKIGSAGKPIPGVEVTIEDVPHYEEGVGEICIAGPNIMQGYHNMPEETDQVIDDEGRFHSGDLGEIDEDGFLWILGRVKEQYKLENGKYVVPAPVEEQLKLSPYIDQIMIEGTGCPYNVAVIVVDADSLANFADEEGIGYDDFGDLLEHEAVRELYEDEIEQWGEEVKSYELPKDFVLVDEGFTTENEMMTPTMKLKRRNIMEAYADELADLYDDAVPLGAKN